MKCKMKDWCVGALSKVVWRANLAQKRAAPDPPSPSDAGERVNTNSTGKVVRDRHTMEWGWIFDIMGQKLRKVQSKSFFQGMYGA